MKVFVLAFMVFTDFEVERIDFHKEFSSMEECSAWVHQQDFLPPPPQEDVLKIAYVCVPESR